MAILESSTQTGISWFGESLALFKKAPRKWLLLALVYLGIFVFLPSGVPVFGLIAVLCWPIFIAVAMRFYRNTELGKSERLAMTLQLIQPRIRQLLLLGLVNIIYFIIVDILLRDDLLVMSTLLNQQQQLTQAQLDTAIKQMMPIFIKLMLAFIPLMVAVWFAPMLIAFNEYSVVKSIKSSLAGCIQYAVALVAGWLLLSGSIILLFMALSLMLGILTLLLPSLISSIAAIMMFGCLLISIAVSLAFQYVTYRDIFRAA